MAHTMGAVAITKCCAFDQMGLGDIDDFSAIAPAAPGLAISYSRWPLHFQTCEFLSGQVMVDLQMST